MNEQPDTDRQLINQQISNVKRQAGESSPLTFALTYLPHHFNITPSSMHRELFDMLQQASKRRGARLAVAAPRGHAKSTIVSLAYILWSICYRKEWFILLISNTLDQASDFLSQIKDELQNNTRLLVDFPEACEALDATPPAPRWRRDEIITRNDVKITALGSEKKVRGRKHRQHRPTLIILDDVENETEVRSADQRRRKEDWFTKAILKVGTSETNVIVVGTVLHYDAQLAKLTDKLLSPGWIGRRYKAICTWSTHLEHWAMWESIYHHREEFDGRTGPEVARIFFEANRVEMLKDTEVLWPEREDYYYLMELRASEGRASFDSEKQNEPVNPDDCYFQESDYHFWDDEHESVDALLATIGDRVRFYGACDPSMGKKGRYADDSAILTLLRDTRTGTLYVIDADIRRRRPDAIIDDILAYHQRRNYTSFAMETNQFQEFLSDELQRRSRKEAIYVPVRNIHHSTDKLGRVQRLQPLVTSGALQLSRRHITLLDQLRQFPMGAHDDGPDALEMAVSIAGTSPDSVHKPTRIRVKTHDIYDTQSMIRRMIKRDRWGIWQ